MTDIYRALSDPNRRKILQLLAASDRTQSEIVQRFDISQPAINKHLKILKEEGLIDETQSGKYRIYRLEQQALEDAYASMRSEIERILDYKLHRLKQYLENEEESNDGH